MNKKVLSTLVALAAISAPLASHASDGSINFNGALISTTCTVTNGGTTPLSVTLPTLATTSPNPTAGDTAFALNISGCEVTKTGATAFFETGPTINAATGRLVNTAAGPTNVELQLLNSTGTVLNLAGASGNQSVATAALSAGAGSAKFIVRYYHSDANAISAGPVTSNVTYSMVYN